MGPVENSIGLFFLAKSLVKLALARYANRNLRRLRKLLRLHKCKCGEIFDGMDDDALPPLCRF